jgi:hypothetical protein
MVTDFKPTDTLANSFHNSGAFMATDNGQRKWKVTRGEVFV